MDVNIILSIIGALISLVAVLIIYNARRIVRERFGIGDQNSIRISINFKNYRCNFVLHRYGNNVI